MGRGHNILRALAVLAFLESPVAFAGTWTLVGWNNLGMHCMDGDYSVLALLPPYNTINAQLIDPQGVLVTDPQARGITVTYEATADPDGSINTTLAGQDQLLGFRAGRSSAPPLPVDEGLTTVRMPGAANTPQPMTWDPARVVVHRRGHSAHAVRRRDARAQQEHLPADAPHGTRRAARRSSRPLDIVLPVSDEMDCTVLPRLDRRGPPRCRAGGWVTIPIRSVSSG